MQQPLTAPLHPAPLVYGLGWGLGWKVIITAAATYAYAA